MQGTLSEQSRAERSPSEPSTHSLVFLVFPLSNFQPAFSPRQRQSIYYFSTHLIALIVLCWPTCDTCFKFWQIHPNMSFFGTFKSITGNLQSSLTQLAADAFKETEDDGSNGDFSGWDGAGDFQHHDPEMTPEHRAQLAQMEQTYANKSPDEIYQDEVSQLEVRTIADDGLHQL